jgi:membrane-bound lytic murein transglycosylase MltF
MKNASTYLIVCLISACLLSCGGDKTAAIAKPESQQPAKVQATGPAGADIDISKLEDYIKQPWTGDVEGIKGRRVIRALVVYSRTLFFYDGIQPRGITYDAMHEFEDFINKRLATDDDTKVHVVFIPLPRDQLIPALIDGRGDIAAANLTITPERSRLVDFSTPTLEGVSELIVTGPGAEGINSLEDLSGRNVFARKSSSYYEHLAELNDTFKKEGKAPVIIKPVDEDLEDEDILEMVNAGLMGITAIDSHELKLWASVFDKIKVHDDLAIHTGGQIAWAFRKNSPELKEAINSFAATHKGGTPFGNAMIAKYYGNTQWVKNTADQKEMKKFNALKSLFQKYAGQYDFDWLLLAAQAYQESGLNQNARSRSGAVGVMQVLPKSAAGPPIFIKDVHEVENNIHAGVKMLRNIIDNYLDDDKINALNKGLFTVASYNAGPNGISEMRKKTEEKGLDPNKWFKNVEVVVAERIGPETVQYVSNVFKYFLAYKYMLEREDANEEAAKTTESKLK